MNCFNFRYTVTASFILTVFAYSTAFADAARMTPHSASYIGTLSPALGIQSAISGSTVTFVQPWADNNSFRLEENIIYFKRNGTADSELWIDVKWTVRNNMLCLKGKKINACYEALQDSEGQAFVRSVKSGLIAKVTDIESGDPHDTRSAYKERQAEIKAAQKRMELILNWAIDATIDALTAPTRCFQNRWGEIYCY